MTHILAPGANIALSALSAGAEEERVEVRVSGGESAIDLDISVLLLGDDRKVRSNDDFVFYNQPTALGGAIQLFSDPNSAMGIDMELPKIPRLTESIAVVASIDHGEAGFDAVTPVVLELGIAGSLRPMARFEMSNLTVERAVVLCELYRRENQWKVRAVGQGYEGGLAELAVDFGVEVDEKEPVQAVEADATDLAGASDAEQDAEATVPAPQQAKSSTSTRAVVGRRRKPAKLPVDWSERRSPFLTGSGHPQLRRARLFPSLGTKSAAEQEMRSTAILLAVMAAVKEFGRGVVSSWGAPGGRVEAFTEVRFSHAGEDLRPDGLVQVTRGNRQWTALVEVKTGKSRLKQDQIEKYLSLAKTKGFDAVVSISGELLADSTDVAVVVDRRLLRSVALVHSSWEELLSEAARLHLHVGLDDPMRALIIEDFLHYAVDPSSGMATFDDMGSNWVKVRDAVKDRTLRADGSAIEVCDGFDTLVRHLALQLSALLGERVVAVAPASRPDAVSRAKQLSDSGELFGTLRVPGAAGPVVINANLRTERIGCSMAVQAPKSGRPTTKVNWIIRQLNGRPDNLRIVAHHGGSRTESTAAMLGALREDRASLVPADGKDIREFSVALEASMGTKRSGSANGFVSTAAKLLNTFYGEVVETVANG